MTQTTTFTGEIEMEEKAIEMIKKILRFYPEKYWQVESRQYTKQKFVTDAKRFHSCLTDVLKELESDE